MTDKYRVMLKPRPSCFCCKRPFEIYKDDDFDEYVYFDNHLYHKKCFVEMNIIRKKCFFCKKDIELSKDGNKAVKYDNHFYHKDCFIDWCNATKKPSNKRQFALRNMEAYISETTAEVNALYEKKKCDDSNLNKYSWEAKNYIMDKFSEIDLCAFLRETYGVKKLPWQKIHNTLLGKTDKCDFEIPVEDILDMWKRKLDFLLKQNEKLVRKNGEVDASSLIMYDLAILINKYDSYCKWKEKQKIIEAENKKNTENITNTVGFTNAIRIDNKKAGENLELDDDLLGLVDDIFG